MKIYVLGRKLTAFLAILLGILVVTLAFLFIGKVLGGKEEDGMESSTSSASSESSGASLSSESSLSSGVSVSSSASDSSAGGFSSETRSSGSLAEVDNDLSSETEEAMEDTTPPETPVISVEKPEPTLARKVVLDPGHGGLDSGSVGINDALEKDINLKISLMLRDMLEMTGFEVIMTRETDVSIHDEGLSKIVVQKRSDLQNRLKIMEENPDAIFVSIHQNKFEQEKYSGAQVFYNERDDRNAVLAGITQDAFIELLQPDNTRVEKTSGSEYYLLHNAPIPAVLVECGFLSNAKEAALLIDEEYQSKVAFVVMTSILRFYETENGTLPAPSATDAAA